MQSQNQLQNEIDQQNKVLQEMQERLAKQNDINLGTKDRLLRAFAQ